MEDMNDQDTAGKHVRDVNDYDKYGRSLVIKGRRPPMRALPGSVGQDKGRDTDGAVASLQIH